MKKYFLLIFIAFLWMCAPNKSRDEKIFDKQAEQFKTGVRKDTVFLDITYGMSQRKAFESFQQKVNDSIFTLRKNGAFEYNMPLEGNLIRVAFHTDFYHDSLYSFSLILKGKNVKEAEQLQLKMVEILKSKYGDPVIFPNESDKEKTDYYFIKDNQKIEIKYPFSSSRTIVTYSDFSIEKGIPKENAKASKKSDTISEDN